MYLVTCALLTKASKRVIILPTTGWHQCALLLWGQKRQQRQLQWIGAAVHQVAHGAPVMSCDLRTQDQFGRLTSSDQQLVLSTFLDWNECCHHASCKTGRAARCDRQSLDVLMFKLTLETTDAIVIVSSLKSAASNPPHSWEFSVS